MQAHLRNFFVIIPALTINFVEKMLAQKDTLKKKGEGSTLFGTYIIRARRKPSPIAVQVVAERPRLPMTDLRWA